MNRIFTLIKKHYTTVLRFIIVFICLSIILFFFINAISEEGFPQDSDIMKYYIRNGYLDTSSKNLVTAIYLDYRLFDSLFEAGILLVTVAGLVYMSKSDNEKL